MIDVFYENKVIYSGKSYDFIPVKVRDLIIVEDVEYIISGIKHILNNEGYFLEIYVNSLEDLTSISMKNSTEYIKSLSD